jgi:hypothetical protein
MRRQRILALAFFMAVSCFLLPVTHAAANPDEIAALYALRDLFSNGWTNASMDNVCTTAGSQPGLNDVICTNFPGDGIHITYMYAIAHSLTPRLIHSRIFNSESSGGIAFCTF